MGVSPEETTWALRTFFAASARRRPLVAAFDDMQWAPPSLRDLLDDVRDRTRDAPILLLCVTRPGSRTGASPLVLEPLDTRDSRLLAEQLLGGAPIADDLWHHIAHRADGNPLFIEEIVAMLLEEGTLERHADGWSSVRPLAELRVPPSIEALLAARLDRLPP